MPSMIKMARLLSLAALLSTLTCGSAVAQVKVSDLPAAVSVADADLTMVVQGGVSKKATAALVRAGSSGTAGNPTASIGLSAVNGVATSYLRSDGAPALSQAIVPTWSGVHTFTLAPVFTDQSGTRTALGLALGTSGATVPLLNGANTWSAVQTMGANLLFSADNTYDIGATGATRPRDFFLGRNAAIGGTVSVAAGRSTKATVTISTATFTPNFDTAADFEIGLTSACPCTLANPSTTPVAGQKGVIYVTQDATGSRTIGSYGSLYKLPTAGWTLTTTASRTDVISYVVRSSTQIVLSMGAQNVPQ